MSRKDILLPEPVFLRKRLLAWYKVSRRDLPWRRTVDPYKIWISEIMLQQTTVKTVIPYYEKWIKTFPDIKSLVRAPLQKVLKTWEGLGYYGRARNIKKTALILSEKFQSQFPCSHDQLVRLPGIGDYTAAAVMSIAFDKPFPVLDANVKRVMTRLLLIESSVAGREEKEIKELLEKGMPKKGCGNFNQALMELGALICQPKNPSCPLCPLKDVCLAYKKGVQDSIPLKRQLAYEKIESVCVLIHRKGKVLIQKRPPKGLMAGLYEFPGFVKKKRESKENTLKRGIKEEFHAEIRKERFLGRVIHAYTKFRVFLDVYSVELEPQDIRGGLSGRLWVKKEELKKYPFTSGGTRVIRLLSKGS